MVFRAINNDTAKLTDKLFLFKKSFTDIGKDLKNGIGIRGFTSIITSKDVRLLEDFNNSIKSGTNYTKAFDTYLSKVPISVKRQGNELIQLNNQMLKLNNSYKTGKIAKQEYNTQMNALNRQVNNVIQNTRTLTVSERIATGVTKGLGVALKLAFNVGIGIAINLFVTAIYKLINAQKEYNEKTKELAENIRQEKEEIKDLYKEYVDISKEYVVDKSKKEDLIKITDDLLEKLGHEKTSIQELVDEYGNLDNAIQNITYENLKEKRGTLSNAKDVAENELKDKYKSIDKNLINNYENYIRANIGWSKFWDDIGGDFIEEYRKWYLKSFSVENAEEFIKDTNEFISRLEDVYYQSDLKKIKIYHALVDSRDELQKSLDEYNRSVDEVNKNEAEMAIAFARINKELPKTQEEFNAFKNNIIDTVLASDNLKKHFVGDEKEIERAITNVLKEMPEFTSFFTHDLSDSMNKNTLSVKKLADTYEKLYEILDKIVSKQEKLAEAFNKIRLGSSLTAKEVYELSKEFKDIYKYIQPNSDGGYTISPEGFSTLSDENIKDEKETLQNNISEYKKQIALLSSLQKAALDVENSGGKDKGLIDHFIQISETTEELRESLGIESMGQIEDGLAELQEKLKEDELYFDVLTRAFDKSSANFYDDAKTKISEFNNELKTFDNAVKTLNEGNTLSYEEMVEIVELAPKLQDFFDGMNGRYTIAADKITEWRKKSFDARNEYIQGLIEQAKAELQTAQDAKKAAEVVLNIQNKFGTASEQIAAQIDLEAAEKKVKDILDVIEKYEALMGDIADTDDSGKKLTDELQNKIDYYKNILDAVGAVKDKYTKAIDDEIDVLQDSKDALKDANDERQREIDLREAAINLENAKKRKAYVYTEGEGFKQVRDEKAVKEAEEKYRDAVTAVQEAEIDKEIKLREDQKEALEENTKALTDLEQDIRDALTIEQAKAALGLDKDSDLLDLPDDVVDDIKTNLADAVRKKDIEDNKGNKKYKEVTLDSLLAELGADKRAGDIPSSVFDDVKRSAYNSMVKGFAEALKDDRENRVENVSYNNSPVINANFVINEADDPKSVADTVHKEIGNLLREYCNSVK